MAVWQKGAKLMTQFKQVQKEVEKIEGILPYLNDQLGGRWEQVPAQIRQSLRQIELAPKLTVSGLEPVNPVIDWLCYSRYLCLKYLEGKLDEPKLTKK
ncbi:hypothetical protein HYZ64_02365 [Candidatus Berkelbacteria bacterium]|nr:hypothetical protein [Candidatus Berkelbacteria bacterium]